MHGTSPVRGPCPSPHMLLLAFTLTALAVVPGLLRSEQKDPPKTAEEKDKFTTVTYEVADLLHKPGGKTGYDRVEDLIKDLMKSVNPESWQVGKENGRMLREANGSKLEIRATAAEHAEIAELLATLRRLMDVAVDVQADLYVVDRNFYDKEVKPRLGPGPQTATLIDEELLKQLLKRSTRVKFGKTRIANGKEASLFSLRDAFTYLAKPGAVLDIGFHGVSVQATATVTPDRRQVRMKITQQTSELLGVRKKVVTDPNTDKEIKIEVPQLVDSSTASSVEVDDGYVVLLPIRYLPPSARDKERVPVMLIQPIIYIEEEEKMRKNNP